MRRLPWVTIVLMILCLVVFVVTLPAELKHQRQSEERIDEAVGFFVEHPYLELQPRFRDLIALQIGQELLDSQLGLMRQTGPQPPVDELRGEEQAHFNSLVDSFFTAFDGTPSRILGLVPARLHAYNLVTYQFMHAGWVHLVFNLLFLFVVGPFIEDVWGRPLFAGFYLAAGIASALMFAVRYPGLQVPLIGASGAIAGVMGAFLVRFVKAKMRFILWIIVPIGPFQAPAWVIFPFWFLIQLFSAQFMDVALPGSGGGGVAFWAHVWGFAFGVVVSAAIIHFDVENRFIHRVIESKITLIDNTAVENAALLAEKGKTSAAEEALEQELAVRPDNVDAVMSLWNLCFKEGTARRALPHMKRALERAVRTGDHGFVLANAEEVLYSDSGLALEPSFGLRIADILFKDGRHDSARDIVELAFRSADDATPAPVLLRLARLANDLESPASGAIAAAALARAGLPPEAREELAALAGAVDVESDGIAVADQGAVSDEKQEESAPIRHSLRTVVAKPRRLVGDVLELEVDQQLRSLELSKVVAMAVCGIARAAQRPLILVDLMLDAPWTDRAALRVVRLTSDSFDPRRLVGGEDALQAFRRLLVRLFEISGAVPLPDPEAARGNPFRSFPTIDAYQREVLGITTR